MKHQTLYLVIVIVICFSSDVFAFSALSPPQIRPFQAPLSSVRSIRTSPVVVFLSGSEKEESPIISNSKTIEEEEILGPLAAAKAEQEEAPALEKAATGTVNERLLAELESASQKEKFGPRSSMGKKMGLDSFRSSKTDAEREAAIEEARNLNGVNPVVALTGSAFALAAAGGLWYCTSFLGEYFALHPIESDVYFVERVTSVFRNMVIGMVSLASGFFGVTGLGIFLLGIRVAYGVVTGELDPTPIKRKRDEVEMPNVWQLMTNQKPGQRKRDKNNPFGP